MMELKGEELAKTAAERAILRDFKKTGKVKTMINPDLLYTEPPTKEPYQLSNDDLDWLARKGQCKAWMVMTHDQQF